jgi:thiol:disulfide interchange protein
MVPRNFFRNPFGSLVAAAFRGLCLAVALAGLSLAPAAHAQVAPYTAANGPAHPYTPKHLYSETADPNADIAAALKQARKEHKRVILDFGGDWCGDCQVLDIYFHQEPNLDLLEKHFLIAHVWIGHMDRNLDIAARYGVPIRHGVPALAVLSPSGKVLYSQATGEFSDMRHMEADSVTAFLNRWKN